NIIDSFQSSSSPDDSIISSVASQTSWRMPMRLPEGPSAAPLFVGSDGDRIIRGTPQYRVLRAVGETLAAWLENHAGREDVHAHQVLQTAKLVTPFTGRYRRDLRGNSSSGRTTSVPLGPGRCRRNGASTCWCPRGCLPRSKNARCAAHPRQGFQRELAR
ncbi:MAG: hypothetical protein ABWY20_18740, partial [Mycobacterium sp.]